MNRIPNKKRDARLPGLYCWIRLRGSPSDPESFDFAHWNGNCWEVSSLAQSNGRRITLQIPDYMVAEVLPAAANPDTLYQPHRIA
jgi:hypothetical protein